MVEQDREFSLMLPVRYNNGSKVEQKKVSKFKAKMISRFGGLTVDKVRGSWENEEGEVINEPIRELIAVRDNPTDEQVQNDIAFMNRLGEDVREELKQDAVMEVRDKIKVDFIS